MGEFKIVIDPKGNVDRLSRPEVWEAYSRKLVRAITEEAKGYIQRAASSMFKNPTGALSNAWSTAYDDIANVGYIKNAKPYAYYLNVGVRRQQMTWLLGTEMREYTIWRRGKAIGTYFAHAPVPIKVGGIMIFRRPSEKGMAEGKWMHPGITAKKFVEWGIARFTYERLGELSKDVTISLIERNNE